MSDLTALLEHEASAEIDAILAEARRRASEIVAEATSEAEAAAAARERASTVQREALLVRAQSAAQLEAGALNLRAQHEAVEAVFSAALERLEAIADDPKAYEGVLGALLAEAVASLGAESVTRIEVDERDLPLATKLAKAQGLDVPVAAGDVRGGVRVRTGRGSSALNSLEGRLASLREELAFRVSEALFGETTGT